MTNITGRSETTVKTLETSFIDRTNSISQTEGLTLRELQGLDKVLQQNRGEFTNNLAKLTSLTKTSTNKNKKYKRLRMMKRL